MDFFFFLLMIGIVIENVVRGHLANSRLEHEFPESWHAFPTSRPEPSLTSHTPMCEVPLKVITNTAVNQGCSDHHAYGAAFGMLKHMLLGDEDRTNRLVEFEQSRNPSGTRLDWVNRAVQRYRDDNR